MIMSSFSTAVCSDSCNHCTECTSPGTCTCDSGWTGSDCCKGMNKLL